MLDDICLNLLNFLSSECEGNKYKILSLEEIAFSLPEKFHLTVEDARKYIAELVRKELISLRYEDEKEICLALSIKGRAIIQSKRDKAEETKIKQRKIFTYAFFGSFLGSAVFFILIFLALFIRGGYAK